MSTNNSSSKIYIQINLNKTKGPFLLSDTAEVLGSQKILIGFLNSHYKTHIIF